MKGAWGAIRAVHRIAGVRTLVLQRSRASSRAGEGQTPFSGKYYSRDKRDDRCARRGPMQIYTWPYWKASLNIAVRRVEEILE